MEREAVEEGALGQKQVRDQATALAEKKKKLGKPNSNAAPNGRKRSAANSKTTKKSSGAGSEVKGKGASVEEGQGSETEREESEGGEEDGEEQEAESTGESEGGDEEDGKGSSSDGSESRVDDHDKGKAIKKSRSANVKVALAQRDGNLRTSRNAKKAEDEAKRNLTDVEDLRSSLTSLASLWRQAKSQSDKRSCEKRFVAVGQSIYNWGVYSNQKTSKEDSFDLLDKLSKMLERAGNATATTTESISTLRSDLQGETY